MKDSSVKISVPYGNGRKNHAGVKKVTPMGFGGTKMVPRATVTKSFMKNRRIP